MLNDYNITYHIAPDGDDINIEFKAKNIEEAVVYAKSYRNDSFSIHEKLNVCHVGEIENESAI